VGWISYGAGLIVALYHIAEAHIREDWLFVGRVKDLKDLHNKSPEELTELADKIIKDRASSNAMDEINAHLEDQRDDIFYQTIMFNRDVLQYIILDQGIKHGDVGVMEDFLLHLLF
jgi:hypothetical protein